MTKAEPTDPRVLRNPAQSAVIDLRILATTDLHAHLLAWDYHTNRSCAQRGLSRVATLIAQARKEVPQSLLFDNGDFLEGSALGDAFSKETAGSKSRRPFSSHPMIMAMNLLRYDAVTLGNHEFGLGLGHLRRALHAAHFAVVSSNLYFRPTRGGALAQTHLMLERSLTDRNGARHSIKIGVMGFIPPQTMIWESRNLRGRATIEDILTSARHWQAQLRAEGADLVIALSHSGLGGDDALAPAENASAALAELPGVDAVIAGHTHLVIPGQRMKSSTGAPTVMPGFYGSHLGVIDLRLSKTQTGWRVLDSTSEARPVFRRDPLTGRVQALVADDPAIVTLATPYHQKILRQSEEVIGKTDQAMNSFFALVSDSPTLRIVNRAQADFFRRGVVGSLEAKLPILSAAAPFKAGGRGGPENYTDVPAGPIRNRHISDLYLHPNTLAALRVTGEQVRIWLERAVSLYCKISPGAVDAPLISPDFPSFNFDVIHGVTYRVDLSQPAMFNAQGVMISPNTRRIVDLCFQGAPIVPDMSFALVTNSYRAAGGVGYAGASPANVFFEVEKDTSTILEEFLRKGGDLCAGPFVPAWSFVPMQGTSVTFDSSPFATLHLEEVPHLRLEPLDAMPSGFHRFRLHL